MIKFATDHEVAQLAVVVGIKVSDTADGEKEIKVSFQDLVSLVKLTQVQAIQAMVRGFK